MPVAEARRFAIREYRSGDEVGILDLFNLVWGSVGLPARDLATWRWQFAGAPLGHETLVAEGPDGAIVGSYAGVRLAVDVFDRTATALLCVDSMVHPKWRRGLQKEGVFLALGRTYFARVDQVGTEFQFGFPNRPAKRIGERLLRYLPLHDPMPVLYHNLHEPGAAERLRPSPHSGIVVREVERFGADADLLWNRVRADHPIAVRRDHRYLNWRYAASPVRYRCHEVRSQGELRGIFVLREGWVSQPILAIADYVASGDDVACLSAVLDACIAHAAATDHVRVEAWLPTWSRAFAAALELGWRTQLSGVLSVIRLMGHEHEHPIYRDRFFVTIGDSDIT